MPKVSVIIPTYNREALISRALDSVLAQTFTDYEIIVVDDGSKDRTQDVLKAYEGKIKYLYQNNGGISAARNTGIKEASGQYIAFLDSDDYWAPEKLAEQVTILDKYSKVGIVYGRMPIINEKGENLGTKPNGVSGKNYQELLQVWGDLPTSSVMTRKECFNRLGFFDEDLPPMEDIDMWLRIARHYDLYEIEGKPLAYYWRHSEQITQDPIKVYSGLVKIHTKILRSYDNIPRDLMVRKLANNQYLLSRNYYFKRNYSEALRNVAASISQYPLVGILFIDSHDHWINRCIKIIKPYGFLIVCQFKFLFSTSQRS
jgi:glycosyltransferase involved in cell wall biosynthesis